MSKCQDSIPSSQPTLSDPISCEREPIHIPGSIQPHGALLAVLSEGLIVTHASANLDEILGCSVESVLGRSLKQVIGEQVCRDLLSDLHDGPTLGQSSLPGPQGASLSLQAHQTSRHICIDIEPLRSNLQPGLPILRLQSLLGAFHHAVNVTDLLNTAVQGFKVISGYDRVIAYRFAQDGHIEVIAEAREGDLDPYLGLHYPASDLPAQARLQYLKQRVGGVVNSSYRPVPIFVDPSRDDGVPLDLTHSALRSVSPIHREYMRNMKTAASLTVGLSCEQSLWGMLVCHHGTPRVAGPELRAIAQTIGQVLSLLIRTLGEARALEHRLQRVSSMNVLVRHLTGPTLSSEAWTGIEKDLLGLVSAEGALVHLSGNLRCIGQTPPLLAAGRALAEIQSAACGDILALDDLGLRYPQLVDCTSGGAGALFLPFGVGAGDAILWFRPEQLRTVSWAGDPTDHVTQDPVTGYPSPRASFAIWKEAVKGRSVPWAEADLVTVRELRSAVDNKRSEIAIHEFALREQLSTAAIESSNDAIIIMDIEGRIIRWNEAAVDLFGFAVKEAVGNSVDIIVSLDLRSEVRGILREVGRGTNVRHHETVRTTKDGRSICVSQSVSAIRSPSGAIIGAVMVARDISEKNRAQQALLDSEMMARGIVETALDAFVQLNESGAVVDWSPNAEAMFGWSHQEAIGREIRDFLVPPEHRIRHLERIADVLRHAETPQNGLRFEVPTQRRDGAIIETEISLTAFRRRGGHVINAFVRDVTEKRRAEEQLRQAQKMESVGQLTGGIAHDFNNMLTVITGTIDVLGEAVAGTPPLFAITQLISDAADRAADLTRRLLAFARKQPLMPCETDLLILVNELEEIVRPTIGQHIEITTQIGEGTWPVFVDPTQLSSALLNLAINADHAMPDGGILQIKTSNFDREAALREIGAVGEYVLIELSDTGLGIPEAIRDSIFEPFFTTKDVGEGTGLGLSMVYGFIKQSGGEINFSSEMDRGTTFRIYLPKAGLSSKTVGQPIASPGVSKGTEVILVVEDDSLVRSYATAQLKSLGYQTLSAANAKEALSISDGGAKFDLLFTDIVMPGQMNGITLVEEMTKRHPALKVLFTSGYEDSWSKTSGRQALDYPLLAKPYRAQELARMLRQVLDDEKSV